MYILIHVRFTPFSNPVFVVSVEVKLLSVRLSVSHYLPNVEHTQMTYIIQ